MRRYGYSSYQKVLERCRALFGDNAHLRDEQVCAQRGKRSSLSENVREMKLTFSWYDNKRHNRRVFLCNMRAQSEKRACVLFYQTFFRLDATMRTILFLVHPV